MIKRRVRLKISGVSHESVRLLGRNLRALCPACGRETEMVPEAEAARILKVDEGAVEQLVGAGRVHAIQTVSGYLWVCKASLFSM